MSALRTRRTSRTRLAAAAATAVLGALSLTACNDGTSAQGEGAAATVSTSPSASASSAGTGSSGSTGSTGSSGSSSGGSSNGSGSGGTSGSSNGSGSSGSSDSQPAADTSSAKTVTCEGSNTRTVATPLTRPLNHMLLTVTNTGSRTCFLYGYPSAQFTDAQAEPPVIEDSQPQAVVTLEPGQSGYAAISLSAADGSAGSGYTANDLTVHFYGRSMSGNVGAAAYPALPAKGVYIDSSIKVTYWQQEMDDAINW